MGHSIRKCETCYRNQTLDTKNKRKTKEASLRKTRKKVIQLDKNNNVVNEYISIAEAQRQTGIYHISCVMSGTRKQAGGYKWKSKL